MINLQIAKEILQVPMVTSVGYKLDILYLFLDDSMAIEERQKAENHLKRLLKNHSISRYEFHYEQGKLQQYAEVGSVLKAGERAGALGCFAKLGKKEEMCVLFSKHVSLGGNSLLVEDPPKSGKFMRFATLLSSNTPDSDPLDIAIAKVLKGPYSCKVEFKDEFGRCMPNIVCLFDTTIWLSRLPVHISRAAGSPGLGIIIIPVLYMENAQNTYLKIEDRDVNERFANPGDSGAIVCANDCHDGLKVHVIAMLMGSSNDREVNQRPETKRQYVAFRLNLGVMQLQQELNEEINFY